MGRRSARASLRRTGLFRREPRPEPDLVVVLPEPLASRVRELLRQGRRVDAVKLTRERTGINLLPAVRAVDALGD